MGYLPPRSRIAAVLTNAVAGLEHFKSYALFKEIEKRLQEVGSRLPDHLCSRFRVVYFVS